MPYHQLILLGVRVTAFNLIEWAGYADPRVKRFAQRLKLSDGTNVFDECVGIRKRELIVRRRGWGMNNRLGARTVA